MSEVMMTDEKMFLLNCGYMSSEKFKQTNSWWCNPKYWTPQYFFEKNNARDRNEPVYVRRRGYVRRVSRLYFLLHESRIGDRGKVFVNEFDLGARKVITGKKTYASLAAGLKDIDPDAKTSDNVFDGAKSTILKITGKKIRIYFEADPIKTLKVVRLLYRMATRYRNLQQLLTSPINNESEGKSKENSKAKKYEFSLSFRTEYPHKENIDQSWLLADLKAYLSVELDALRRENISRFYAELPHYTARINRVIDHQIGKVSRLHGREAYLRNYDLAIKKIKEWKFHLERPHLDLDDELFCYVHQLEFEHFAVTQDELAKEISRDVSVSSIFGPMEAFARRCFPEVKTGLVACTFEAIEMNSIELFIGTWRNDICSLMAQALGEYVVFENLPSCITDARNLINIHYWFRGDANLDAIKKGTERINVIYLLAGLCCAWQLSNNPVHFEPHWVGKQTQGGSLVMSMKSWIFTRNRWCEDVPEEHNHLLKHRVEWFAQALLGNAQIAERRFAFMGALVLKVADFARGYAFQDVILAMQQLETKLLLLLMDTNE